MGVGSQHYSSSAKTGHGVVEIFRSLAERIIECKKNKKVEEPKMRKNMRGALNVGGMSDFEPDANLGGGSGTGGVRLTRADDQTR
jgi:hypothetical protein